MHPDKACKDEAKEGTNRTIFDPTISISAVQVSNVDIFIVYLLLGPIVVSR